MLGYRTFFHVRVSRDEVIPLAMSQLYAWLRRKRYDADAIRPGEVVSLATGVEALMLESSAQNDTRSLRVRVIERKPSGKWVSQLTVHVPRRHETPWIWLDIEAPDSASWTGTPGLARNLLEVFPAAYDGEAVLGPAPIRATEDDAETLLDVVCDPDRRGLVLLAGGNDALPVPRWLDMVAALVKETAGLAATYVLDGSATECFNRLIGVDHAVASGTVRTFLPAVDPADPEDALRHRVLGTRRILRGNEQSLSRLLGWKARERAIEAPLPRSAVRIARVFDAQADELLLALLTRAPRPEVRATQVPEDSAYLEISRLVNEVLGGGELTSEALGELGRLVRLGLNVESNAAAVGDRIRELQRRVETLELENYNLNLRVADEQLEHAVAIDERVKGERTIDYLRKRLIVVGRPAEAWTESAGSDDKHVPDDFRELMDRFNELKFVRFTGDVGPVHDLDKHDPWGTWAKKTWQVLLALEAYGRVSTQQGFARDVHGYLENAPEGCSVYPLNKHARDESADVHNNDKFRAARVFSVPPAVAGLGEVFMGAHFRIAQSGMISPRLHYYDDSASTRLVYVGYIGRHLPTKRTN